MSEFRQNLITKEWVIIDTENDIKPESFFQKNEDITSKPVYVQNCPFCPGNEEKDLLEPYRLEKNGKWQIRAVQNRFPAVEDKNEVTCSFKGINRLVQGIGKHYVIVETPLHNKTIALLSIEDVGFIIKAYKDIYELISKDSKIKNITIFKNHGISAGASQAHPHSQVIGLPIVPLHIRSRIDTARSYYDDNLECIFCCTLKEEIKDGRRIILESDYFVAFIPYAALSQFHIWLFPKIHSANFGNISNMEIHDLAKVLKELLYKLYYGLGNPDYNFIIRSSPKNYENVEFFHWYLSIVPRITKSSGFEMATGMYINTLPPERSASFLKNLKVDKNNDLG